MKLFKMFSFLLIFVKITKTCLFAISEVSCLFFTPSRKVLTFNISETFFVHFYKRLKKTARFFTGRSFSRIVRHFCLCSWNWRDSRLPMLNWFSFPFWDNLMLLNCRKVFFAKFDRLFSSENFVEIDSFPWIFVTLVTFRYLLFFHR